jgi:hypothetical protein
MNEDDDSSVRERRRRRGGRREEGEEESDERTEEAGIGKMWRREKVLERESGRGKRDVNVKVKVGQKYRKRRR